MKKTWKNVFSLTSFSAFAAVVFMSFSSVDTVIAQSQSTPPCCVHRWDPVWTERDMWGGDMMGKGHRQRMARHRAFMHGNIPSEYLGKRNPLKPTRNVVLAGSELYQQQCAVCHGAQGMGDGEAAKGLNPSPALLAYMIQMPMSVDEYMLWSISEGGKAFGTAMPAFKDTLSEEEIWKIVTFMRAGFPSFAQSDTQ
jgi:cytochrome c553